jgi:hypothetical protein
MAKKKPVWTVTYHAKGNRVNVTRSDFGSWSIFGTVKDWKRELLYLREADELIPRIEKATKCKSKKDEEF